jgi:hypothetical protein
MKAWICICAGVFAAVLMPVLAQETGATAGAAANTNAVAVPPPVTATSTSAPAAAKEVKPPVAPPPAVVATPPKVTPTPRASTSAVTPSTESSGTGHKAALTNPPPAPSKPASMTDNEEPPAVEPSLPTNTVPEPPETAAAPTEASSGTGHISLWVLGVALLVVAGGGLAVFLVQRGGSNPHGSLITSAMNEIKKTEKAEEKHEDKPEDEKEAKVEVKKFPPSMN